LVAYSGTSNQPTSNPEVWLTCLLKLPALDLLRESEACDFLKSDWRCSLPSGLGHCNVHKYAPGKLLDLPCVQKLPGKVLLQAAKYCSQDAKIAMESSCCTGTAGLPGSSWRRDLAGDVTAQERLNENAILWATETVNAVC
jgi:hypothetical protein